MARLRGRIRPSGSPGPGDQIETGAGTGLDPGGPAQPSPQALCFTELSERTITQRAISSGRYTPWLNFELNLQGLAHESVRQNPGSGTSRTVADHCGPGLCPEIGRAP